MRVWFTDKEEELAEEARAAEAVAAAEADTDSSGADKDKAAYAPGDEMEFEMDVGILSNGKPLGEKPLGAATASPAVASPMYRFATADVAEFMAWSRAFCGAQTDEEMRVGFPVGVICAWCRYEWCGDGRRWTAS